MPNKMYRKILISVVIVLFIVAGFASSVISNTLSSSKTIYVDDDNTEGPWDGTQEYPYRYIQDGVDNATRGDTIYVYNGIYYEKVIIWTPDITLLGENRDYTIIDGQSQDFVLHIFGEEANVKINGFTIQNCKKEQYYSGINIASDNNIIENVKLINNEIGIQVSARAFTLKDCIIENNVLGIYSIKWIDIEEPHIITKNYICNNGYGILLYFSSYNIISDNDISNNAYSGIYFQTYSRSNNVFNNTINSNKGTGIHFLDLENNENEIYDNTINKNGEYGILFGGEHVYRDNSSKNRIINNTINFNGKDGIQIDNLWYASIHENIISGNTIISNGQNGISLIDSKENVISGNIIQNNPQGINILNYGDAGKNIISGNGIYENSYGIYIDMSNSNEIQENNIFSNTCNAHFESSFRNKWKRNYWGRHSSLPYIIHGFYPLLFTPEGTIGIRWINVDWFPAKESYDIPIP